VDKGILNFELTTLKRPSALIPLAMSIAALGLVLGHIALFGGARQADEGAAAHLWCSVERWGGMFCVLPTDGDDSRRNLSNGIR